MTIKWSGVTTSYNHICDPTKPNDPDTPIGFRQCWVLDAQWSTCPKEVQKQVKVLWHMYECGNDKYAIRITLGSLLEIQDDAPEVDQWDEVEHKWLPKPVQVDAILQYIEEMNPGMPANEQFFIYYWW